MLTHVQTQSWSPVSMGLIPQTASRLAEVMVELSPKGKAYLDLHRAEMAGKPLQLAGDPQPVAEVIQFSMEDYKGKKPEFAAQLKQFEFSTLEEVTAIQWNMMYRRLVGHASKMIEGYNSVGIVAESVSMKVVQRIKSGQCGWNPELNPNLLSHMFNVVRGIAKNKRGEPIDGVAKKTRRGKRREVPVEIRESLDVNDVVQHLPTIALLVSRLNDLLNPVAKPSDAPAMSPVGRIAR